MNLAARAGLVGLLFGVAACGSATPPPPTGGPSSNASSSGSSSGGTSSSAGGTAKLSGDAYSRRDKLLQVAVDGMTATEGKYGDFGIPAAWSAAFGKLQVGGWTGIAGDAPQFDVSMGLFTPKGPARAGDASAANPYMIIFSVADSETVCTGAVITGYPKPATVKKYTLKPKQGGNGPVDACSPENLAVGGGFIPAQ